MLTPPAAAQQGGPVIPSPLAPALAEDTAPRTGPKGLADLRNSLDAVAADLQTLRATLQASGTDGYAEAGGTDAITRMDQMESRLRQLTAAIEETRNLVSATIDDSAARLDDLEFRLCQIEPGCDLSELTEFGRSIGAGMPLRENSRQPAIPADSPGASPAEQAAFDALLQAAGDHADTASAFADFADRHPASPFFIEARMREGLAWLADGNHPRAEQALTEAFAADPDGALAPISMLALARLMAAEGDKPTACLFLADLLERHAGSESVPEALALLDEIGCNSEAGGMPRPPIPGG